MIRIIIVLLFCLQVTHAFELPEKEYPQITGAQIFVLRQDPDILFEELKNKGINTVFFRVFHNDGDRTHLGLKNPCSKGGVYFASANACTVEPLFEDAIAAAHRHGIKIYAWMATRSLSFLKTPANMSQSFTPDGLAKGYGASIFKKEVRQTITELFREIALTGADGILIQDDFILKYSEGAEACDMYQKDSGKKCNARAFFKANPTGDRLVPDEGEYDAWASWKAGALSRFFVELRREVRLISPEMKWAVNIYYEVPVSPDKGLSWYSHNLEWFMEAGADYLAVMAYQEQISSELNLEGEELLKFAGDLADSALAITNDPNRIIFKIQAHPFYGGRLTPYMRAQFYNELSIHGGQSFVELPVSDGNDIMIGAGVGAQVPPPNSPLLH